MGRGAEKIEWPIHLEVNVYVFSYCLSSANSNHNLQGFIRLIYIILLLHNVQNLCCFWLKNRSVVTQGSNFMNENHLLFNYLCIYVP